MKFLIMISLSCTLLSGLCVSDTASVPADEPSIQESFGKLPLYFIENQGQMDEEVAFYVKGADKTLYFTPNGITFAITERKERSPNLDLFSIEKPEGGKDRCQSDELRRWIVKMEFVDANPDVSPSGEDQQKAVFSYFKGRPEDWNTGVPTYSRIVYENLWPGIDLVYYGTVNQLKYDFIVKPGADPKDIRFAIFGASDVVLDDSGFIEIDTPLGSFKDEKPTAYQEIDGKRLTVPVAYSLDRSASKDLYCMSFEVWGYDPRGSLVIDPAILMYCGYIGGSSYYKVSDIALDESGNAYVTGYTYSVDGSLFPVKGGPDHHDITTEDAFVVKVAATGTQLEYCCYIGGTNIDKGDDIAVDGQGNAYVTGLAISSESEGFPVLVGPDLTFNGEWDAFVAKVSASGTSLVYCGYIGGADGDCARGIDVNKRGGAYVTGSTLSSQDQGFPVLVGPDLTFNDDSGSDTFVAKVAIAGTHLEYCGYIGGSDDEYGTDIAIDWEGNAYLTGFSCSSEGEGFPVVVGPDLTFNGGDEDVFVTKVAATGTHLEYSGFIGGSNIDTAWGIAVDSGGSAYITGLTLSKVDFPVKLGPDLTFNSNFRDGFIAKVAVSGTELVYCGFIGGALETSGSGVAVDKSGNAYVTGTTASDENTFPVLIGPDLTYNGYFDSFVAKVAVAGTRLLYCGYIGGWGDDIGSDIAVDGQGSVYVVGLTGSNENSFPVKVGPDLTYTSGDGFIAKVANIGLYCDKYSLSAANAGTIDLTLLAGTKNASNEYLLAAGISGSSPGVNLPTGLVLPLNWDFVSDFSVLLNNTVYFYDFLGTMDLSGQASARFEWPGIPGSAGMSLYFAFCTRDPVEGFNFVSNPVEIALEP